MTEKLIYYLLYDRYLIAEVIIIFCVSLLLGCAAHTGLEPSGRGNTNYNVNFGGPIVAAFGTRIPIPYLSAGINHGIFEKFDLNVNVHLMKLAYGVSGLDLGGTWYTSRKSRGLFPVVGI